MKRLFLAALLTGLSAAASAEVIILKDGTRLEGEFTGEMDGAAILRTKYGSLTINTGDILSRGPEVAASSAAAQAPGETLTFKTVQMEDSASQKIYSAGAVVIATETFSSSGILLGTAGVIEDGVYREYYPLGALKTEKKMSGGKVDGGLKVFFENGIVQTEAQYAAGVLDGPVIIRSETGTLQFEQNFKNGVPNGWFRQYDAKGNVKSETQYVNGVAEENPKWTDLEPVKKKEGAQAQGQELMLTAKSQRLARVERVSFYVNNKYIARVNLDKNFNIVGRDGKAPDGSVKVYSADGKLEKEFIFEQGEVKRLLVYEPGGPLMTEYAFREGKAERQSGAGAIERIK